MSVAWTGWKVFVAFPNLEQVYDSYDVEITDAYEALTIAATSADIYLHPLYAQHATFAFLNADGPVTALDGSETIVIRDRARPVSVVFPAELEEAIGAAGDFLAEDTKLNFIRDANGEPLLMAYHVAPAAWGDMAPPTDAPLEPRDWSGGTFGSAVDIGSAVDGGSGDAGGGSGGSGQVVDAGAVRFVGVTVGTARRGEPLPVRFVWESLAAVDADLTVFVHLKDAAGNPAGQLDREPARASFRTTAWRPGDLVIDQYAPVVDANAVGPITIEVGWYDGRSGDRLAYHEPADASPAATSVTLGPVDLRP
jgi:hypothetical protein